MATEIPSHILRKRTAASDMTVLENSVRRGSASHGAPVNDLEQGSRSSVVQNIANLVAYEVGPSLLTVGVMLSLIFGGCCSNVRCHSQPLRYQLSYMAIWTDPTHPGFRFMLLKLSSSEFPMCIIIHTAL